MGMHFQESREGFGELVGECGVGVRRGGDDTSGSGRLCRVRARSDGEDEVVVVVVDMTQRKRGWEGRAEWA